MRKIRDFCRNHREIILYLVFGGLTFLVSTLTYALFNVGLGIHELIANIFSWIFAVTFAYITNKIWVFQSRNLGAGKTVIEGIKFFGGRVFTFAVEELILFIFITRMHFNSILIKVIAQIVVIVLNYVISKLFVFRKNRNS